MMIPLPGNAMLNASHVSLVSGLQPLNDDTGRYLLHVVLLGKHENKFVGTKDELRKIRDLITNAVGQA